ncbi:flagellar biosynthesis anti-sigma factor FlgM [Legionella maioricensis]|uniref:Negative regulator of flagellin synthesis n=1 Tax=Legionella maioricensis TaxID=2896528 RepID=A0A9X2D3J7_9GAMM|nr:flagellar biosynthesis anti-sigma factor FlgM [Legionella maioricensis]MCL9685607.1 flagellar biosynthesis anti-sigma factor FlgM [Legionella maioricensis]MCL9689016.1 flagellar biosynthesis anti-sigma factor FlgM [Legionella maioricensis]
MLNVIEDKIMVNQINDSGKMKSIDSDGRLKAQHPEARGAVIDNSPSSNKVSISSASKQLEALKASLQDVPEINEARVLYFKAEIQSGNYLIQSDKIARSMLNNLEMA